MSRWLLVAALLAGSAFGASENAEPGEPEKLPAVGPLGRLVRGVTDVVISPLEIPATIRRVASEHDPAYGVLAGGAEGIGNALMRLVGGVIEIVSFPVPGGTLPMTSRRLGERAAPPLREPTRPTTP